MNYEEIIEKIEDIIDEGKPSLGGGNKIKVDGDAIRECLKELSASIPSEIIQARKIVTERRDILQAAQETANKIIAEADQKAAELTEDHQITKTAKDTAFDILNKANAEANAIKETANEEALKREKAAKRWAYELRTTANKYAQSILGECANYLEADIEHFTQSRDSVDLALSRLAGIVIKDPDDPDVPDESE